MEIIFIGSGGCMRELAWQMQEQNKKKVRWSILGYVDNKAPENMHGVMVGRKLIPYLGTDDYLLNVQRKTNVVISIGNSLVRKIIAEKLLKNNMLYFPNIVLDHSAVCDDVQMNQGCIISRNASVSTNVILGDFTLLNIGCTICHDGKTDAFVTLSPNTYLAGNVTVGKCTELGMGTNIIQGVTIGEYVISGAGSVIIRDTENHCTMAGVPARKLRVNI